MARLHTQDEGSLSAALLKELEPTRMNGKIADVYLQFANSEPAILAYLQMEASLKKSSLSELEIESIKLLVSEINQCDYCLAIHTMKSRKAGIDKEMQMAIRSHRRTSNARVDALLDIVRAFFEQPGPLSDEQLGKARESGLTDQELVETAMAVSTIFFTNITNHINNSQTTVPAAPPVNNTSK